MVVLVSTIVAVRMLCELDLHSVYGNQNAEECYVNDIKDHAKNLHLLDMTSV